MIAGRKLGRTILILVGLVLPLQPAFAEPTTILQGGSAKEVEVGADDSVVHHASKFLFPSRLGDMPVRKIVVYGPGDVSVDYSLRGGGNGDAWISLFVYPAAHDLTDEAADIEATLIDRLHPSRIPAPRDAPPSAADGRNAWYHGAIGDQQLTSAYVVVRAVIGSSRPARAFPMQQAQRVSNELWMPWTLFRGIGGPAKALAIRRSHNREHLKLIPRAPRPSAVS